MPQWRKELAANTESLDTRPDQPREGPEQRHRALSGTQGQGEAARRRSVVSRGGLDLRFDPVQHPCAPGLSGRAILRVLAARLPLTT